MNPLISQDEVRRLVAKKGSLVPLDAPQNKYGVADKSDRFFRGELYDSKAEAEFAAQLDLQVRMGLIGEVHRQVPFSLCAPSGEVVCRYFVDFEVVYSDGRCKLFEVKGYVTPVAALKMKWFRAQYPELDLEVVRAFHGRVD